MTITAIRVRSVDTNELVTIVTARGEEANKNLSNLFQRALNTWAEAPAECKEAGDIITNGKVLQDYYSQERQVTE